MIISASRRTDIPAFYAEWFINRIRAGYCCVPNPFNRNQVSRVSLLPEDVDVIVFWTRNPRPLIPFLEELDHKGYRYYFQYTILNNPRQIDPKSPPTDAAVRAFRDLSGRVGADRVIWRYDPIVITHKTGINFHLDTYQQIASSLETYTRRSIISIMDPYAKTRKRLRELSGQGYTELQNSDLTDAVSRITSRIAELAMQHGMEIFSCSEEYDLTKYGVRPGKCIDNDYIQKTFGNEITSKKDPSQRKECGCVVSKDIGMYDSCLFECQYCYATQSFDLAHRYHSEHNPSSPSLIGWHEAGQNKPELTKKKEKKANQLSLFDNEA